MLTKIDRIIIETANTLHNPAWAVELTAETCAFVLLLSFAGLAGMERRNPKIQRPDSHTRRSYRTNIGLFISNNMLVSLSSIASLYWVALHFSGFGPLNYIPNPVVKGLLAFVAIDLFLYGWHALCHKWDMLWLFHRVHHNDPYLNVSTAFRLHIVEMVITHILKASMIVLLGIDKMLVLIIETLITMSVMFHHANIGFPFERVLARLIIVPFLHRVHHSTERSEHDSNYGAVLSVWDRLFGTALESEVKAIGIKGESPQDILGLFKFGFGDNTPSAPVYPSDLESWVAVAAYYRAEKRNFTPGDDLHDWLEAKSDVLARFDDIEHQNKRNNGFFQRLQAKLLNLNPLIKQQFNSRTV